MPTGDLVRIDVEVALLLNPYYVEKTPPPATMGRIKGSYPLNPFQKRIMKTHEKKTPGN